MTIPAKPKPDAKKAKKLARHLALVAALRDAATARDRVVEVDKLFRDLALESLAKAYAREPAALTERPEVRLARFRELLNNTIALDEALALAARVELEAAL